MIARMAKFFTALGGAAVQIVNLGLVDGDAQHWITVVAGVLTAAAVYMVPNASQ